MFHEIECGVTRHGPPYSFLFLCFLLDEGRHPGCCWPLDLVWLISQPLETSTEVQNKRKKVSNYYLKPFVVELEHES